MGTKEWTSQEVAQSFPPLQMKASKECGTAFHYDSSVNEKLLFLLSLPLAPTALYPSHYNAYVAFCIYRS